LLEKTIHSIVFLLIDVIKSISDFSDKIKLSLTIQTHEISCILEFLSRTQDHALNGNSI